MTDTPTSNPQEQSRAIALAPAQIKVGDRLRTVKAHRVATLKADMEVQGQLQPVLVVETETAGVFELVDGAHRLAALIDCKAAFVEALALPASRSADLRMYAQIMANVNREELTKLERAEHLSELRDVWQKLNPSAQHGGDRRSANVRAVKEREAEENFKSPVLGLLKQVANEAGLGRTQFFIAMEIANGLFPATKARIRETWIANHQAGLQALAKVPADVQARAVDALLSDPPTASSVADALLLAEGRALPKNDDKHYHRVTATWSRLSVKSRRAFIDEHKREILDHVRAQGWEI